MEGKVFSNSLIGIGRCKVKEETKREEGERKGAHTRTHTHTHTNAHTFRLVVVIIIIILKVRLVVIESPQNRRQTIAESMNWTQTSRYPYSVQQMAVSHQGQNDKN